MEQDSYADFINEQSVARKDYKDLMERLQSKQLEAQTLRDYLQDEISSPQNPNPLPTQAFSPASKQTSAPLTTKSVDQTMQSKQTEQQNPPKLPHTDRVVSRGPSSPPFHEEPNPLEQVKTFSKPIICEAQAGDENANSNTRSVSSESPLNIHGTNGKAHTRDEKLKANTPKICTEAPSSAQYKLSQFSQTGASNQHQTNSMDILVQQPPPNQLPVGFAPLFKTDDPAVIRSVAFHPRGHVMAIGSNSRVLKLCSVPEEVLTPLHFNNRANVGTPTLLHVTLKKSQVHRGSIYSLAWNDVGNILATCSNDKLIKIFNFNEDTQTLLGPQYELTHHDGMVRDVTFLKGYGSGSVLASGGSTDFVVYTYACEVDTVIHQLTGHSDQILSLYSWNGGMLTSASQDRSVRIWDLRSSRCVSVLGFGKSAEDQCIPLCVCVDAQGNFMGVGRDDSKVSVYDLRASRLVGDYGGHSGEVRSARFNPVKNTLLMTSSYDGTAQVTDVNSLFSGSKDLPLSSFSRKCKFHSDKVIQCRWHHEGTCFATTSADQSCVLWRTVEA